MQVTKQFTLEEIARRVGGELAGDASLRITGAATLADARPGDISLADDICRAPDVARTAASAVITPRDYAPDTVSHVRVADVHAAFAAVVALFKPPRLKVFSGVSPEAVISPSARIAPDVQIHPDAVIGDDVEIGSGCVIHSGVCIMAGCQLGRDVVIFPGAVLYEETIVGDRVLIHGGSVLGASPFAYEKNDGRYSRGAQLGRVKIESDCDIGARSVIQRGVYGATVVRQGTKLDNQVAIGHDCHVGRHNIFCAQAGIAGGGSTGSYVVLAGQAAVVEPVHVGDLAILGPQCGVEDDLAGQGRYQGVPARPEREMALLWSSLAKLADLRKQARAIMKTIEQMRAASGKAA
jgi:UDP-3-O-[3-hydroxymyristoyl] glucosamine N-acyltransferase